MEERPCEELPVADSSPHPPGGAVFAVLGGLTPLILYFLSSVQKL